LDRKLGIGFKDVFPRQDSIGPDGLGNLVRLPLWNRSEFVDVESDWATIDPHEALIGITKTTGEDHLRIIARNAGLGELEPPQRKVAEARPPDPSDWPKAAAALDRLSPERADDYDSWILVGMSIHYAKPEVEGLETWDRWSRQSKKYEPGLCSQKWGSFSENGNPQGEAVTIGTILAMAKEDAPPRHELTDLGNADRLVERHGDDLRHSSTHKYLVWTGCRFERDAQSRVVEFAKETARSIHTEAADEPDPDRQELITKWAIASQRRDRISAMTDLAKSDPAIVCSAEEFDADPFLLNVKNGTLDLRTGELRQPHRRSDLLSRCCPVEYHEDAEAPRWMQFLDEIFDGRHELTAYMQRACGYFLSGDTSERVVHVLHGPGANGRPSFKRPSPRSWETTRNRFPRPRS
jgi:hypothetical protein